MHADEDGCTVVYGEGVHSVCADTHIHECERYGMNGVALTSTSSSPSSSFSSYSTTADRESVLAAAMSHVAVPETFCRDPDIDTHVSKQQQQAQQQLWRQALQARQAQLTHQAQQVQHQAQQQAQHQAQQQADVAAAAGGKSTNDDAWISLEYVKETLFHSFVTCVSAVYRMLNDV